MNLEPNALCTLDAVKDWLGSQVTDAKWDDLLIDEINAASSYFAGIARREFVDASATRDANDVLQITPSTRTFDVDEDLYEDDNRDWMLDVGDLAAAPTLVKVFSGWDGTLIETVDLSVVVPWPRRRKLAWEPYSDLRILRRRSTSPTFLQAGNQIQVTAPRWGFPEVPPEIAKACKTQVALWFARDVRQYTTTFRLEGGFAERPRAVAPAIRDIVRSHRV